MEVSQVCGISVILLLSMVQSSNGMCYKFTGNGRVEFSNNITIGPSAQFRLTLRTREQSGILYYAEGLYHAERVFDYEGLFIRDGFLHYFLFNPAPYSIGSTFGFHGKSKDKVNDGKWHTVEFYRNILTEIKTPRGEEQTVYQTGLKVDEKPQATDNGERIGVDIRAPIILGEDPHFVQRSSGAIGGYRGKIKDFHEITGGHMFEVERVLTGDVSHCITGPDAGAV